MRLCRSPCRSSSVRFCRSSRRYAAALRCLQFGRLQLADDWTLSELQSWPPPLATSRRSQRGGLRGVPRGRGDGKSRPPASPGAARADHGASRPLRCRERLPESDSFSRSGDRLSRVPTTGISCYLAGESPISIGMLTLPDLKEP